MNFATAGGSSSATRHLPSQATDSTERSDRCVTCLHRDLNLCRAHVRPPRQVSPVAATRPATELLNARVNGGRGHVSGPLPRAAVEQPGAVNGCPEAPGDE